MEQDGPPALQIPGTVPVRGGRVVIVREDTSIEGRARFEESALPPAAPGSATPRAERKSSAPVTPRTADGSFRGSLSQRGSRPGSNAVSRRSEREKGDETDRLPFSPGRHGVLRRPSSGDLSGWTSPTTKAIEDEGLSPVLLRLPGEDTIPEHPNMRAVQPPPEHPITRNAQPFPTISPSPSPTHTSEDPIPVA
ncbi:hypothetical protein T484DRAFT_3155783 [Baffinella frigidus]|nr:hypothetical protein T484DRAFT_3155783 [Cryptophyta sp. CCMP2293]